MSESPFLVTGASGFVGRHLLETAAQVAPERRFLALVRDRESWSAMDWTGALRSVETVEGSVTGPRRWESDLPPLAGIFHLAALVQHSRHRPEAMLETNVEGALAMVRLAAAHGCRMLLLSSSGTVGCFDTPDAAADETAPYCEATVARWPYYRSKIEAEKRARALAAELGVELVVIRPPILLGPGDHRFRSTGNVLRVLRGRLPFLVRGGMHFADVRDAAQAMLRAMLRPRVRPIYHLEGTTCSVEEFFGMLEEVSGAPAPRIVLPFRPAWLLATAVEQAGSWLRGEPPHLLPDPVVIEMAAHYWGARSLHAADDLGYKARDPRETLRETAEWLRANHASLRGSA